ncbi:prolipoprotein diacylglyceryl transferase [Desulfosporosinus sp. FKA]|uniref:prolipoprotein diacylglyceryl transferase n=1 Tax=Desulfosporosinus sp. FKA TaxID=1969834 RepID=UPI000B4993E7|nr:prolipoprotein diacylglyceryl transferase [Desulfosporosinus sp. FKA]
MRQIFFNIGSFSLRSYGIIVALALLLGLGVAYTLANNEKEKDYRQYLIDIVIYGLIGGLIGARIWQVFFYEWDYYATHLQEIIMIWRGGMSILGALVGAAVAGWIYTRTKHIDFWKLADIAAPGLIFGQSVGRIACLLNGDAYGSPTNLGYGLVYPPGTPAYSVFGSQPLWPAEVWEGQWDMIVFALILMMAKWRKWTTGYVFLAYIILYSIGRFSLEFLRGDSPRVLALTTAQWSSVAMIAVAIIAGLILRLRSPRISEES